MQFLHLCRGFVLVSIGLAFAMFAAPVCGQNGQEVDARVSRYVLPNGIRVLSVHVEDAPRQSMFTYFPLTLANDPAHQAQWAHLIEHLLIRSTDPDSLMVDGMQFNGETGAESMRLESYVEIRQWKTAIERHARWIQARQFDVKTFEQEKLNIAGEEQFVQGNGYTHKFSIAAWNQIVHHGVAHAEVHGDVETALVEDVQKYAQSRLPVNEQVFIAMIGPVDPMELKETITKSIGQIPATPTIPLFAPTIRPQRGHLEATWDFNRHHVILWWEVSLDNVQAQAVVQAIARKVMMQILDPLAKVDADAKAVVHPAVQMAGNRMAFLVNISFANKDHRKAITDLAKQTVIDAVEFPERVRQVGRMYALQLQLPTDLEPLRTQMDHMQAGRAALLEPSLLLNMAQLEFNSGLPYEKVAEVMKNLSDDAIEGVSASLKESPTGILFLQPKSEQ